MSGLLTLGILFTGIGVLAYYLSTQILEDTLQHASIIIEAFASIFLVLEAVANPTQLTLFLPLAPPATTIAMKIHQIMDETGAI